MTSPVVRGLLLRGQADWLMLGEVAWVVRSIGGAQTDEEVLDESLQVIRELVESGLMEIGDVTDAGFFDWEESTEQALARIRREWLAHGPRIGLGEVCWLCNTPAGDGLAETIRAETGQSGE